jgi:hypothetical protein
MKARRAIRLATIVLVLLSMRGFRLAAQTNVTWDGGNGNWNTPGDWSGGVVPNNGGGKTYNVTISNGEAETVSLNLNATVSDLTLGSLATLQSVAGDSLTIAGGGTLSNSGTLLFNTTGSNITVGSGGSLINNGTIELEASGETLKVTGNTTNASGANLTIEGGSAATFTGNVTNSGTFTTGFSGGNNTVTVTGTFTNASGATLALDGSGDAVNLNALSNSGTVIIDTGATLNLTGGGQGITNVAQGSELTVQGTLNVKNGSTSTNGLGNLTSVQGVLNLDNGQTTAVTPNAGTLTIASGGQLNLSDTRASTTTLSITGNVTNSGAFSTGFDGGKNTVNVTGTFTNAAGATAIFYGSSDAVNVHALSNSGTLQIGDGAGSGATLTISGGGQGVTDVVAGSSIEVFGSLNVKNGTTTTNGLGNLTSVEGTLTLNNNQTTAVTPNGGTLTIAGGGQVNLSDGAGATTTLSITGGVSNSGTFSTGFSGGTNTVTVSGTFTNNTGGVLTLDAGANASGVGTDLVSIGRLNNSGTVNLVEPGATLDITGAGTLTNSGNFNLTQGALKFNSSSATLSGGGTLTLGNSNGTGTGVIEVGSGDTGTLTNSNNTITGYGNLGNGTLTLVNHGTISANGNVSSGTLTVQPGSGGMTNTGTIAATNQATLVLKGTFNNSGGTIEALGESGGTVNATAQLAAGTVINGGTLNTTAVGSNTGVIENTGTVTLNGVTNTGTYTDSAGTTTKLDGTITNMGSITLGASTLSLGNSVTLNGTGTVVLSNSATNLITGATSGLTLTTANTIEGSGTISNLGIVNTGTIAANQSTPLIILPSSAGLNNQGTLSVSTGDTMKIGTSAGGALLNFSGTTLTGGTYAVSGTLQFGASGTNVVTDAANISLTGGGAAIIDFGGHNVLTKLATITSAGSLTLSSGANFTTAANFTNNGKLTVNAGSKFTVTGALSNFNSSTDTLTGGSYTVAGRLDFAGANIATDAANITLNGTGEIVNSTSGGNGLANLSTITSAGSFTLDSKASFTTAGNLTDDGRLTVNSGSTLTVNGRLTNFNGSTETLASGTYTVGGTLKFNGANIVNNAANLTISGTAAKILNGTTNGLANFANNTGSFTVTGDGNFTTGSAAFTNSGRITVATGSALTVGGGNSYTQSAGTTTVDGTLSASGTGINVTGGNILGGGELSGNVTFGGSGKTPTISAGDSGKAGLLAITGNYTQLSTASMNSFIGGTTVGTQYSQLQVGGTASLAGTLTVTLASGFTPTIGSTFTVLTAGSVTGTFFNSTIAINGAEHFIVSYTSTGVVLTVASGAATQSSGSTLAKRQPILTSGLRRRVIGLPQARLSQVAAPVAQPLRRLEPVIQGAQSNNWTDPSRGFSSLHASVTSAWNSDLMRAKPSLAGWVGSAYYVSTSGSDSNAGTMRSPWLTIQHAANSVSAGATVYVFGGVYNESVNFPVSGTASAPITFQSYPGQTAVIDGTGVACCTSNPPASGNDTQGLINIVNQSHIIVRGFEIRNFTTSKAAYTPAGIWITGSGTGIQLLNNLVHNITTSSEKNGNAFGIAAYGTSQTPISGLVIRGNQVYSLKTGNSESVNVDGNVTNFSITSNLIHDNDNIGIDAIGYEDVGPVGYDEAMYGEISGNTIYNISGINNAGEGKSYDADGIYCDGCAFVTIEQNLVFRVDYGIEVASEHKICQSTGTEYSSSGTIGKGTFPCNGRYVTVRNNVVYDSNACGVSIGGYSANVGGSANVVIVNNTLYNNNTKNQAGEFQVQYHSGSAQGNIFENNIVYAGPQNVWINSFVKPTTSYPAPAATLNWNLYYSAAGYVKGTSIVWAGSSSYKSYSDYKSTSGEDSDSPNTNPLFVNLGATPPDFDIAASSPAVDAGSTSLSCSVGWCNSGSIYGSTDFNGNSRTNGSNIDIGAYESTGDDNSLTATLRSMIDTLQPGQSTTLTATVSAGPGDGGVPSGTLTFMLGSTLLATEMLVPTSATESAAVLPLSASTLAQGANRLRAVYSGNSVYRSSTSPSITVTLQ